jgi:hypothetical protein
MASQDDLALLKQMHQRGEITDAQYDVLRRHVLWGTPLPQDVPAADPRGGYVPGAATVGPERFPGTDGARPGPYPGEPAGTPPRRYASRRERREAEEAGARPAALPPAGYLPPGGAPPRRSRHRRDDPPDEPAPPGVGVGWTGDPVSHDLPSTVPRRGHRRRDRADEPDQTRVEDPPPTRRRTAETDPGSTRGRTAEAHPGSTRGRTAETDPGSTRGRTAEAHPGSTRRRTAEAGGAGRGHGAESAGPERAARRRPRRRSVVAVLTSVLLALLLAAGGVYWFVLRTVGLPPATYAREACGAVRDWHQTLDNGNATLIDQISRQENKTIVRADVTAYYTTIAGRTDQLRTAILGLGAADITGGREYADSLAAAVGDQATALRRLAERAGRLDPAAPQFATDLQTVLTGADSAVSAVSATLARPAGGITTDLRATLSNDPACAPYVG